MEKSYGGKQKEGRDHIFLVHSHVVQTRQSPREQTRRTTHQRRGFRSFPLRELLNESASMFPNKYYLYKQVPSAFFGSIFQLLIEIFRAIFNLHTMAVTRSMTMIAF